MRWICEQCGETFERPEWKKPKFCSRSCSATAGSRFRYRAPTIRIPEKATDRAYLAAIIDGEGFINRRYQRETSRVEAFYVGVTNTSIPLMEWLAGLGGQVRQRKNEPGLPVYVWNVRCAADVLLLLAAVSPYMRIKQEKALDAISTLSAILTSKADAYGIVSLEALDAGGVTPEGLNVDALNAALAAL